MAFLPNIIFAKTFVREIGENVFAWDIDELGGQKTDFVSPSFNIRATSTPEEEQSTRCRFHQHFRRNFFVQKCFVQLFSSYSLALWFFVKRLSSEKLLVKCWWTPNWLQIGEVPSGAVQDRRWIELRSIARQRDAGRN